MTLPLTDPTDQPSNRLRPTLKLTAAAAMASTLVACGGGGGGQTAQPGTGGTGSYASGPITGFGSVIINGIRYEYDDDITVRNDDDDGLQETALKLGATIEVEGSTVTPAATAGGLARATATSFRVVNEFKGPFSYTSGDTFRMLGQDMLVNMATVYEGASDLADAQSKVNTTCRFAEVYAYYNTHTQNYTVTRFECDDSASEYRLYGLVSNLNVNTSSSTFTFNINGLTISGSSDMLTGLTLTDGETVRVRMSAGNYDIINETGTATRITVRNRRAPDTDKAEVKGLIDSRTESAGVVTFNVNGLPVRVSSSTELEDRLTLESLVNGARVEVEGRIVDGVLQAREVELEDSVELEARAERQEFVGLISSPLRNLDGNGGVFTLTTSSGRVFQVTYEDTDLDDILPNQIANGFRVEVKGRLSSDGESLTATEIDAEDD